MGYTKLIEMDLQNCYDSPIDAIVKNMEIQAAQAFDNEVIRAVHEVGIKVDKDKLAQALQQDKRGMRRHTGKGT